MAFRCGQPRRPRFWRCPKERPRGWQLLPVTPNKVLGNDVPLYLAPPSAPAPVAGDAVAKLVDEWRSEERNYADRPADIAIWATHRCAERLAAALAQDRASQAAAPSAPVAVPEGGRDA